MKNVENNKLNRQVAVLFAFMALMPSFVFGADAGGFKNAVDEIVNWMTAGIVVPVFTLVIMGVFIYWWRNLERFKEVFINGLSIIIIVAGIMGAPKIAQKILEWVQ